MYLSVFQEKYELKNNIKLYAGKDPPGSQFGKQII
ncbi:hypothetical protein FHW89_000855 [Mucilaginibacter sp. SG564]|nr:hypothetical protein [Mucilaginibacter sp. SG564]